MTYTATEQAPPTAEVPPQLFRHWVHSREEDQGDVEVYRPDHLDFDDADVVTPESFPPQYVLRVSGTKPYASMDVRLVPLVHVRQPEYWGIEVVGSLHGLGLPVVKPYEVSLAVTTFLGTAGIEVIGATRQERLDIEQPGERL
ncbi:hypothetical protein [Blastococcus deserti]|uniref:Uncharacterized protein n=1 Tax=Blastococcus deserti TaxID=2259033 RepID=A0ABW4XDE4_9ACTN